MTTQRFRRFLPFVLGQRIPYRFFTSLMLLVLILMCLPALSSAQQTCQPDGDVNQNGSVTAVDALLAFQQALNLTQLDACQLSIADVFPSPHAPDGNVTASDALCIFQKALGSPSCFDILPPSNQLPMVSAGADHTCGILETGAVACWGLDDEGQSTPPAGTFTTLSAGADHTCGILETGAVTCWGLDDEGQSTPPAGTFTTLSAGADHTCGILETGAVTCWGLDDEGQSTPPAGTFTTLSAGADHTCGILETGVVACWGLDDDGQSTPPAGTFTTLSAGADHTCGILETGVVACWGLDDEGQSTPPAGIFTTISAGADHTCGILETGVVACWGLDDEGQSAPPAGTFTTLSAGADHTCGILETGVVACWGLDDEGQSAPPGRATTPDLVVASPLVSDSNPDAGAFFTFTLSATVRNEGDGASAAITLRYYRSADATITASDTAVGTDAVAGLAASGTSEQAISLTAPSTPGTYYYGVCVDTVTDESDTTNNCSASVQVTVPEPERPDLEMGTPTVDDARPETGATFTLSVTVSNTGDGESSATTLRYYRSTDATITTSDTVEGTAEVGALAASGTSEQSISLTAPAPGTYYYGTCVDTVTDESDTTNNCSAPVQVGVEAPTYPDLEMGTPTVDDTTPETGASFTLSATVSNAGDGESSATTLRYYRSTDSTITTSDTAEGTADVGTLAASGTSEQSISLTAPAPGTYYYGACVDTVAGESDTTDNCSSSVQVGVEAPTTPDLEVGKPKENVEATYPDLEVETPTVDDTTPETGASFTLSVTVSNTGDGESSATTLRYYRSTDATITTSDTEVGTDEVSALVPSAQVSEGIDLTAPSNTGAYYYGACVDAVAGESNTANNCSRSVKVTVPAPQPDLVVSASVDDGNLNTGDSFTLSATVRNAGDEQSAATTLRYYRSTDSTISSSDTQVGTDAVGALAASGTSAESISLTAPSTAGTYYYGACVDSSVTDESDTTNNCSSSVTIAVEEASSGQPDLRIVGVIAGTSPFGVFPGSLIQFSANVRNYGDANSDATTLRYYRSADATISVSDTEVGTDEVSALAPSVQVSEGIDLTAPSPAGTYYYGACVDPVAGESDTTNNCSSSVQVVVSEPELETSPDLMVGSASVNDSSLETGGAFTLSATVSNTGDGESGATALRYYRSTDATITTSDTSVGTDAVGTLAAAGTSSESISLTAPSTAGMYYYGACVDTVTGESDTTNNCSSSVTVTVSEPQTSPDLSVGSPTVNDSSLETGGAFTLSATVSNAGDAEAAATYYYGACVDTVAGESDTTNNCSSSVTVTVAAPEPQPDLIVDSFTITLGPTLETSPGALVYLNQRVANVGDAGSAATTVRYYRSTDATITTSDTQVSTDAVPELAASSRFAEVHSERLPTAPGTYYYGACVDAVAGESNTANNCSRSVKVTVPEPQPDLVVGSASVDDSNLNTGDSFTLSATVRNAGVDAAVLPLDRFDDLFVGHSDRHGRGGGTDRLGDECRVDLADRALNGGHVLLRGVRGRGDGRVGHHEQLFVISDNRCGGGVNGAAGLEDRWGNRGDLSFRRFSWKSHPILSKRPKLWRREFGCHDAAILPLGGRNDLRVGHGGRHGRSFCAGPFGPGFGGDPPDGAVAGWHVLLRGVRGPGGRGVGHDEQLLVVRAGGGIRA